MRKDGLARVSIALNWPFPSVASDARYTACTNSIVRLAPSTSMGAGAARMIKILFAGGLPIPK
jgi:hypothetical protein